MDLSLTQRGYALATLVVTFLGVAGPARSQLVEGEAACGPLQNAYGPFDYRYAARSQTYVVERYHFTREIELLSPAIGVGSLAADLDYTLRAIPNHHRALAALSKLAARVKRPRLPSANYPTDCYFDRAMRFAPDDAMTQLLFGLHLIRTGRSELARPILDQAAASDLNDPNFHYNLGLAYLEIKEYDKALQRAKTAYAMGWPLPGLRDRLKREGKWRDD